MAFTMDSSSISSDWSIPDGSCCLWRMEPMEVRKRVSDSRFYGVTEAMDKRIAEKFKSLQGTGCDLDCLNSFRLGYISGMSNPTFEAVKESVEIMTTYSRLSNNDKEIIDLIMLGMKERDK